MKRKVLFILSLYILYQLGDLGNAESYQHDYRKRELPLLFPNGSSITFIAGFGIPVNDLYLETVLTGMVFKCSQILPSSPHALRTYANHKSKSRQSQNSKARRFNVKYVPNYRLQFYNALEKLSESFGYNGHNCVLKSICEISSASFHYENGILGDIINILMLPSSSTDLVADGKSSSYFQAEQLGKTESCDLVYKDCKRSIISIISKMFT